MPTTARAENHIIRLFVSGYEKGSRKDAALTFPDEVKDGGIDGFAESAAVRPSVTMAELWRSRLWKVTAGRLPELAESG